MPRQRKNLPNSRRFCKRRKMRDGNYLRSRKDGLLRRPLEWHSRRQASHAQRATPLITSLPATPSARKSQEKSFRNSTSASTTYQTESFCKRIGQRKSSPVRPFIRHYTRTSTMTL